MVTLSPLLQKLLRDAGRHKAQFIAVAITMFLGVTLFAASYDSFRNLQASYDATATDYRFANLTISGGDIAGIAEAVQAQPGIESVTTRTVVDLPIEVGDTKLLGRAVGMPATGQPVVNRVEILSGTDLGAVAPGAVLVEQHMAEHFGLEAGDSLSIFGTDGWKQVNVAGVIASPEYIWPARDRQNVITTPDNFGVVFAAETLVAELSGGGPNEVLAYYTGGEADPALTATLSDLAWQRGATGVMTRDEQPSNAALSEDLRGFEEMAVFFPVLFLAAAAMAAYVTISRMVATQRPHIGVMLANGFTRRQVLMHYLGYGLLPGIVGSIPGAIAGVLLARLITGLYTDMLAVPVTLIQFYPLTLAAAIAFGIVASLLAALAPALVASRIEPAAAMRGETPAGGGRPSLAERALPPLRRLPVRWRMALRGAGRNPRRTAYTILGVVLSLTLVLVSWGMIDTVQHLLERQFVDIEREDATVYFTGPVGTDEVAALEQIDGVERAEPMLQLPVSVASGAGHYDTVMVALNADTDMHGFVTTNGEWTELPASGILVGSALHNLLGVDVGSPVAVTVESLGATVDTKIAGFIDEPMGTMTYVARDHAAALMGAEVPAGAALIRYEADVDAAELRTAITALPQVAAFEDAQAIYTMMREYMVLFYAFVGVMLVFGGAMAFALIFNSMSVNIAERTRETATLLAVGTDRRTISRHITAENMLVALPGIPLGLVAGYFMSKYAMATFESDLFAFDLFIRPTTFVIAALAIVAVALLSQWPGLRAVRRIDIAKVVKERSA